MSDLIGSKLGDYHILEPIGAGGMGQVYLAEHLHLRKRYAVKVLPTELAADASFIARFRDEARVMADLRHPHIVEVHYMGQSDDVHFLVMDYVTGPNGRPLSLHEHLKSQPHGRLAEGELRKWAAQIVEAMDHAHRRGVVHRDLKPANILIDPQGDARLTDFGLAKAVGQEFILSQIHETMRSRGGRSTSPAPAAALDTLDLAATLSPESGYRSTSASSILGTYDYMSPEQRGEHGGAIDERTDIYAFGVVVYRLLTGKRPVGLAKPPSQVVPGLSKSWDKVVARCMAELAEDRYASAAALLRDLPRAGRVRIPKVVSAVVCILLAVGVVRAWYAVLRPAARATNMTPKTAIASPTATPVTSQPSVSVSRLSGPFQSTTRAPEPPLTADGVAVLATQATQLCDKLATLDRGQEFGPRLDGVRSRLETGRKLLDHHKMYREAKQAFDDVLSVGQKLLADEAGRAKARDARQRLDTARNAARDAGAATHSSDQWEAAGEMADDAAIQFEAAQFEEAAKLWTDAAGRFDQITALAGEAAKGQEAVQAVAQAAQQAAQTARDAAQSAQAATLAREDWEEAEGLANLATRQFEAGKFEEAKKLWGQATSHYQDATGRADEAKRVAAARAKAQDAQRAMELARNSATEAAAMTLASEQWNAAEGLADNAVAQFEGRKFEDAERLWIESKQQFEKATAQAQEAKGSKPVTSAPAGSI